MNRNQISLIKEALVLNGVLKNESGKLDEASFKRLLKEAEEIEKKAEEIEVQSGGAISKRDGVALVTAIYGGLGTFAGPFRPVAWAIDATLAIKFIYDATQAINAISALNDVIEGITGKDALSPLNQILPFGMGPVSSDLLSKEDIEAIRNADPATKEKARQYAISAFQYLRRAIVSGLGMIPDVSNTGVGDAALAGISVAIAMSKSFTPALVSIVKASANISRQFKTLHKYAQADTVVGRALRLLLNYKGHYNLGMVMIALDILEPGAGDELRQYVNPAGASRGETEREVIDAIRKREKEKMDSEEAGLAHRKRKRDLDAELEKERQTYRQTPDIIDVTPVDDQRVMQESANAAIERWQLLAGVK